MVKKNYNGFNNYLRQYNNRATYNAMAQSMNPMDYII